MFKSSSILRSVLLCASLSTSQVVATEAETFSEISFPLTKPHLVGESEFSYLFWDVYTARLFAYDGKWKPKSPFALKLTYARDFKGEEIAERSAKEMRAQKAAVDDVIAQWQEDMLQLFPDVKEGDQLIGIATDKGGTAFYFNDGKIGQIDDSAFTKAFFDIWLGDDTSQPEMRKELLGEFK